MTTTSHAPLRLAFIGMSGSGKTFWARKLAEAGYPALSCDDLIEERLQPLLAAGGYAGIGGVAAWMGWPDSPHYCERESQYLREETAVLDEVLADLARQPEKSLVLDTTGSVIYTGNHLLMRLRRQMKLVYLAASPEEQQLLIERYLSNPKPVLWRGAFQPRSGETPRDTVARCYPALIAARRQSYEVLGHCAIPIRALREAALDAAAFLALVQQALERAR
jgi:shikimate kinase